MSLAGLRFQKRPLVEALVAVHSRRMTLMALTALGLMKLMALMELRALMELMSLMKPTAPGTRSC